MAKKVNSVDTQSGDIAVQSGIMRAPADSDEYYMYFNFSVKDETGSSVSLSELSNIKFNNTIDVTYTSTKNCLCISSVVNAFTSATTGTLTFEYSKGNKTYNKVSVSAKALTEPQVTAGTTSCSPITLELVPPTLSSEIARLTQAKADIKAAIEAKGVTVGSGTIDTYASKIGEISSGGSTIEDGDASNLIFNFYFVPMGSVEDNVKTVNVPNGKKIVGEISKDITIHADFSLNVNMSVIRSQYISETDTRTTDIKVLLNEVDAGNIYIACAFLSKTMTFSFTNESALINGYDNIEYGTLEIYIGGLSYPANFSCRAVMIEE